MSNEIATQQADNPYLQVARETKANTLGGRLLKFVKGDFKVGADIVPAGGVYVAHVDKIAKGYSKFVEGRLVDQQIGRIADGFKLPARESLGDNDQSQWECDNRGDPKDPWNLQFYLPLEKDGEIFVFVASSQGGQGAIGALCEIYGRTPRPGLLPIIKLVSSSYQHKKYGRTAVPEFPIVSWHHHVEEPAPLDLKGHVETVMHDAGLPPPEWVRDDNDLDSEIPF